MREKNRDYLFDNAKCLLIYLVVFAHLLEGYTSTLEFNNLYLVIYMFHMPFFIFISGYFSKNDEKAKNKLLFYYFIPYIIYNSLYSSLLQQKITIEIFSPNWAFWYLISLCMWKLLTPYMKALRFPILTMIIVAVFAGYCTDINRYLSLSRMIVFFPYFIAGNLVTDKWIEKVRKIPIIFGYAILVILILGSIYLGSHGIFTSALLYAAGPYTEMTLFCKEFWLRFSTYPIAFLWILCLMRILPTKKTVLSWMGKYTMPVFIVQTLLIRNYFHPNITFHGNTESILAQLLITSFIFVFLFGNIVFQKLLMLPSYLLETVFGKPHGNEGNKKMDTPLEKQTQDISIK